MERDDVEENIAVGFLDDGNGGLDLGHGQGIKGVQLGFSCEGAHLDQRQRNDDREDGKDETGDSVKMKFRMLSWRAGECVPRAILISPHLLSS